VSDCSPKVKVGRPVLEDGPTTGPAAAAVKENEEFGIAGRKGVDCPEFAPETGKVDDPPFALLPKPKADWNSCLGLGTGIPVG
jgi:hypothetical protein